MSTGTSATWDGSAYAVAAAHHRAFDDYVLEPLALRPGLSVLDVGCGTGDLAAHIADLVGAGADGARVVGVDPDGSQLEVARRHEPSHPGLSFSQARAQDLVSAVEGQFDVVLSVAALHWIRFVEHPAVLRAMAAVLRPGGLLRLDFGGEGQVAGARAVLDPIAADYGVTHPWSFPAVADYLPLLDEAGFDIVPGGWMRRTEQTRAFPDEDAFLGWVRTQILIAYTRDLAPEQADAFCRRGEAALLSALRAPDGSFDQPYVRLDVLARRRKS